MELERATNTKNTIRFKRAMSIFADDRKIIKFKCPHCGAKSGQPCITKTGKRYTGGFHMLRKGKVFPDMVKPGRGKPLPKYDND